MGLTGTEVLYVAGVQPNNQPSATPEPVTLSQVAGVPTPNRGTFTANGTSAVTVPYTGMALTSVIAISLHTVGGTVGAHPVVNTITAGTGFTVVATASDTSVYNWAVV